MVRRKVASRYAKAVFDFLEKPERIAECITELEEFSRAIKGSEELRSVLFMKVIKVASQKQIIEEILSKMKLSQATRKILLVICEMKRMDELSGIVEVLKNLLLDSKEIVPLEVEVASEVGSDGKSKIENRFAELFGKAVEAHYHIDPKLIGGVRVTAAGKTYDGTLTGWLSRFEERN